MVTTEREIVQGYKAREIIFDPWTPMSFKRVLGNRRLAANSWMAPTWVGDHVRRLQAYKVLQAYIDNTAREFLQEKDQDVKDQHREYGDASLMVQTILAALLGDDQVVVTEGSDDWDPDENKPVSEKSNADDARAAWGFQDWMRQWAVDERLGLKMIETERNAVGLGDGVYVLGVDHDKERVRCRVFDPGFYFPVLLDQNEDEFPNKVHLAWELETDEQNVKKVRRITWEVVDLPGNEKRNYPWNDKPSRKTCLMSDGTWTVDIGGPQQIEDFTEARVEWEKFTDAVGTEQDWHNIDLRIDFVPVVHMPNTVSILNHYGRSSISTILQILDDLSSADTDLQAASATTGTPPVALSGASLGKDEEPTYGPGKVWQLGANGKMDVLDTSSSLDALLKYTEALLRRASVNGRVPESVLGRVDISGNLAGITLALSFGPLGSMVKEMRLVRDEKYPLLMKFVHRMAQSAGWADVPAKYVPTKMEFGAYLPQDTGAAVDMVQKLLTCDPPAVSIETAVRILIVAGLPIDNALDEVQKITGRDFTGATALLDATGDEDAVFDYLGRDKPAITNRPTPPPTPAVPPQ